MNFLRCLALLFLLSVTAPGWAINSELSENQIKAAYLYKFASYVEWPAAAFAQADSPLAIAIIGADEVAAELETLTRGRVVNGRLLQIKSLQIGEPITGVHILFIGQQVRRIAAALPEAIKVEPILIVTDTNDGLDSGGIINFVLVDNNIRFEVSTANADRCSLKISARLLSVAQKIETGRAL